ncbi:hypothetical protein IAT38_008075 [Cryptococcus sp. DSM 104549]
MSHHRPLPGAKRPSDSPRIHSLTKPYNRPLSYAGLGSSQTYSDLASLSGDRSPTKSPSKPIPSSRVQQLSNGHSPFSRRGEGSGSGGGGLPRSGSEGSLLSGFKSIFARPLQWLSTPGKTVPAGVTGSKRGSLSSFGHEMDDPESPSDRRDGKRVRRKSPEPATRGKNSAGRSLVNGNGQAHAGEHHEYEPEHRLEVQGRAVSGFMLPPLGPTVSLKPRSQNPGDKPLPPQPPTNFSRPLTASHSMPYLDPPPGVLRSVSRGAAAPSPRKAGMLTRSKRVDLASTLADEQDEADVQGRNADGGKELWSPWKSKYAGATGAASSAAAQRSMTPGRKTPMLGERDSTIPTSPFRNRLAPSSSLTRTAAASGSSLARSATTANVFRQASVASDVSMASGGGLGRSSSIKTLGPFGTSGVYPASVNGDQSRMSVDGEGQRDGGVLHWYMKDRWDGRGGSPASIAASQRISSATPSSHPPIRKGQLVWNQQEKVFVRESDYRASQLPEPVHKNEAERILHTLESLRKTPLSEARREAPTLVGQSSRTLRKTINVPLATAAAGDSARLRRDKERLGDSSLSVMISPYGRRKVADKEARDARRQSKMDTDFQPSPTPSDARSEKSNVDMESVTSKGDSPPAAAAPPTPRRSSRLKRNTSTAGNEEEATPKARRTTRRGASKQPETIHEDAPKSARRTRKTTVERATSPTPPPPVPAAPLPTITATAPSPGGQPAASTSTYQPRADGDLPRGQSSLRAKSGITKRAHQSAAGYSRSQTPSSGRFSAREEDMPEMDEIEMANKIPLPSFSGISFAGLTPAAPSIPAPAANTAPAAIPVPSGAQQPVSLPRTGGPLARLNVANNRPRASSPLAAGSFVAAPDSPPDMPVPKRDTVQPPAAGFFPVTGDTPVPAPTPSFSSLAPTGSTTPAGKPPASSFFSKPASPAETPAATTDKPAFSFGLGKPSAPPSGESSSGGAGTEKPSGIPNFFGAATSTPSSGTTTPITMPTFDFGIKKPAGEMEKAPPAELPKFGGFGGFGAPAGEKKAEEKKANGEGLSLLFGGKEGTPAASPGGFSFGGAATEKAATPAPAATSSFSFGAPKPAEVKTDKPAFSFGAPAAEKPKADEAPKSTFSFGAPAATPPATTPSAEAPKPAFSFGAPSASTPAAAAKPAFSFGASAGSITPSTTPAPAFGAAPSTNGASTTPAAAPAFGGFSFGKPAEKPAEKKDASPAPANPFGGASTGTSAPAFTFGAPAAANGAASGAASPFGKPAADAGKTANPFGQPASNGDAGKTANPFGQAASTSNGGAGASAPFTFGAPKPATNAFGASAPAPSNPFGGFGGASTNGAAANGNGSGSPAPSNPFGAPSPSLGAASKPAFSFGSSTPAASTGFGAPAATSNPFGQQQPQSSTPTAFTFGASAPAQASPSTPSFAFGAPAQQNAGTPTTPSFGFGQQQQQQAAPAFGGFGQQAPQGGAPGFSFGGGAAAGIQANAAARFKSPTPALGDGGGFSLGVADAGTASPGGGRKVRGLPKRR